jgi:hypothetical protein
MQKWPGTDWIGAASKAEVGARLLSSAALDELICRDLAVPSNGVDEGG